MVFGFKFIFYGEMEQINTIWKKKLEQRMSKQQITDLAMTLHHDECGISDVCRVMLYSGQPRSVYNAAWILHHLAVEDKDIYLRPYYDRIVDMAVAPELSIRRGLVLSILAEMPTDENARMDLFDFCMIHMTDIKENDSSRSMMIKLAAEMCKSWPELSNELLACLDLLQYESKPSISAARRKALKRLKVGVVRSATD